MPTNPDRSLVLATNNPGKLAEMRSLLAPLGVDVVAQSEFALTAASETGLTFVENAIIKARHAAHHTGLAAIADDSGLEVDALDGAPGVFSARFAGPDASDAANRTRLLEAMAQVAPDARSARFHCVMVYLRHASDPAPLICQGTWEGAMLERPRGNGGFGYDPLFWIAGQHASAAELAPEVKNRLSHRGQAARQLISLLR